MTKKYLRSYGFTGNTHVLSSTPSKAPSKPSNRNNTNQNNTNQNKWSVSGRAMNNYIVKRYNTLSNSQKEKLDGVMRVWDKEHPNARTSVSRIRYVNDWINLISGKNRSFGEVENVGKNAAYEHSLRKKQNSKSTTNKVNKQTNNPSKPAVSDISGYSTPELTVLGTNRNKSNNTLNTNKDSQIAPNVNTINTASKNTATNNSNLKNTPAKSSKPASHTIKQGETLGSIAKQYGVDWRTLASDNGISDPNMIIAGRKLNINGATKAAPKKKAAPVRRKQSLERTKPIVYPSNGPTRADIASAYADRLQGVLDSLDARAINTQVPTQALGYANQPSFRGASLDDLLQMGY